MKFSGKVVNQRTIMYHPNQVQAWIDSLEGHEITLEIKKQVVKKSGEQNRGLHVLLNYFTIALNDLTGNTLTMQEVKEIVKKKKGLIEDVIDKRTGNIIDQRLISTADLDKQQTSELIEFIYAWAATEFNITLPELKLIE